MKNLFVIGIIIIIIIFLFFIKKYFFYKKGWLDLPELSNLFISKNIDKLVILSFEDFLKDYLQDYTYYSFGYNLNCALKHPVKTYYDAFRSYNIKERYIIQFPTLKEYIKFIY